MSRIILTPGLHLTNNIRVPVGGGGGGDMALGVGGKHFLPCKAGSKLPPPPPQQNFLDRTLKMDVKAQQLITTATKPFQYGNFSLRSMQQKFVSGLDGLYSHTDWTLLM